MEDTLTLFAPMMQYGFGGLVLILLAIVVWLFKQQIALQREGHAVIDRNTKALNGNTVAINDLETLAKDQIALQRDIHDKLLSRPCLVEK